MVILTNIINQGWNLTGPHSPPKSFVNNSSACPILKGDYIKEKTNLNGFCFSVFVYLFNYVHKIQLPDIKKETLVVKLFLRLKLSQDITTLVHAVVVNKEDTHANEKCTV